MGEDELYSYDKYKHCHIFIETCGLKYYASIQTNGTTMKYLEGYSPERLLDECKVWVDSDLEVID